MYIIQTRDRMYRDRSKEYLAKDSEGELALAVFDPQDAHRFATKEEAEEIASKMRKNTNPKFAIEVIAEE